MLVVEDGEDLWIVPRNVSGLTMSRVFRDTGYRFVGFGRAGVSGMLPHARPEADACLANVTCLRGATAGLKVDTFRIEFVRARFVPTAE